MTTIDIGDILTEKEIKRAIAIYEVAPPGRFADMCAKGVIEPVLDRINKKTGQQNYAKFLAYAIENSFNKTAKK